MILVTGATGGLGSSILNELINLTDKSNIAGLARNAEKADSLIKDGVKVVEADYDTPEKLVSAFQGVDKLVFISGNGETEKRIIQHKNVVEAAVKANVKHLYYTSFSNPVETTKFTFTKAHTATENLIKESGLHYTFFRNALYADILLPAAQHACKTGALVTAAPQGKAPFIPRYELAKAIAKVVTADGEVNKVYELTGSSLYSYSDVAEIISAVTGKHIKLTVVTPQNMKEIYLSMQLPEFLADGLASSFEAIEAGEYESTSSDFKQITGRDPMDLKAFIASSKGFIMD